MVGAQQIIVALIIDVVIATAVIIIVITVVIIIQVEDGQEFGCLGAEVSGNGGKQDLYLGKGLTVKSLFK